MKNPVLVVAILFVFSSICSLAPVSSQALEPGDKMQLERPSPASKAPAPIKPGAVITPKIPVKMQPTIDGKTPVVRAPLTARGRVFKLGTITRQQADQLQNSDLIEYQGKQYDVGTLRSNKQKADVVDEATMRQKASRARSEFEADRKNFSQGQMSKLAAGNAKIDSVIQQLSRRAQTSGQAPAPAQPTITEISVPVTPGARVLIVGSGFGSASGMSVPGTVYLNIGTVAHPLVITWWSDTHIAGTIPAGIEGIPDGPGNVVVKVGGVETNRWPVAFIASRAVSLMFASSPRIQLVSCGNSAVYNDCSNIYDTLGGRHGGDWYMWAGKGNDVYSVSLINGWTFENTKTGWGSGTAILKGFSPSSSSLNFVVDWSFEPFWNGIYPQPGNVDYLVGLYIVGPKGVPYY